MNTLIGKRIKTARIQRCVTQKELGEYLEKTSSSIMNLERGDVRILASDLYKISIYLNKPIQYFFEADFDDKNIEDDEDNFN